MVSVVRIERIAHRISLVRGRKVLLDADLAALYGVSTKRFNEQVRRNAARFPEDFMFRLTAKAWSSLRSQFATLQPSRGKHRKYVPLATGAACLEQGTRPARRLDQVMAQPQPLRSRPIGFVLPAQDR